MRLLIRMKRPRPFILLDKRSTAMIEYFSAFIERGYSCAIQVFERGVPMLEVLRSASKTIGIKQTLKAVENKTAGTVFIAGDAEEKVVRALRDLCIENSVEIVDVDTMKQLGKACGIEVGAAAACILKSNN